MSKCVICKEVCSCDPHKSEFEKWYQRKYPNLVPDKDDLYKQLEECFEAGEMSVFD
jgi:hypothetical protein